MKTAIRLPQVFIVLDTGFGDGGKGMVTHTLCVENGTPEDTIVSRFSGGHQAGHNVVLNIGLSHNHSSFPSGTISGYPGYITEHCVIYPSGMRVEHDVLISKGVNPKLTVHPHAIVTTPFDVSFGQKRERDLRHGSCGVGIGATMSRHLAGKHVIRAIDLYSTFVLRAKLMAMKAEYDAILDDESVSLEEIERYISDCEWFRAIVGISGYEILGHYKNKIFEGAQGIMLDKDHGTFPHVTYANTTSKNAFDTIQKIGGNTDVQIYYVTRWYQTRHGNGPMTDERHVELVNTQWENNVYREWQGKFRLGRFDPALVNHAALLDMFYHNTSMRIFTNLVVTCIDQQVDGYYIVGGQESPDDAYLYKLIDSVKMNFDSVFVSESPYPGIREWH